MLVGILKGSLASLMLYLLAVRSLHEAWAVEPYPSAGGMYWMCLALPLVAGSALAALMLLFWRRARPAT